VAQRDDFSAPVRGERTIPGGRLQASDAEPHPQRQAVNICRRLGVLRDLQKKRNLAYLFISHDLKVIRALCNYVIVMRNGKAVEEGPAERVFAHPKEDYTRTLLAAAFDLSVDHRGVAAG
jgi:ABC-type oligopeptide transport system ATPase subunit